MYADTFRSPELRHEVPIGIPDPFLYAEKDGVKHIAIGAMEIPRLAALGLFELHPSEEFGSDELIALRPLLRRAPPGGRRPRGQGFRDHERGRPRHVSALARRPPARGRCRADGRRRVLRRPPPREDRGRARRDPARAARGRGRNGCRARSLAPRRRPTATGLVVDGEPLTVRARQGCDVAGIRGARHAPPTTSSSRRGRKAPSGTTWAPARSAQACRS